MRPLEEVRDQISPGEIVVWAEHAGAFREALRILPTALIGIPFLAFALFWTFGAWQAASAEEEGILFFPLFGLIFVAVGIAMVLAPIWGYAVGLSTLYAITNRRLLIIRRFPTRRVVSYEPHDIEAVERRDRGGGGDIFFGQESRSAKVVFPVFTPVQRVGFFGIPEVRRAEEEIRKLKTGTRLRA